MRDNVLEMIDLRGTLNMSKIMLDNLTISRLPIIEKYYKRNDLHIQNYLYSLVLWDEIICVEEEDFVGYSSCNERNYIIGKKSMGRSIPLKRRTF